jgi:hypothetical protein
MRFRRHVAAVILVCSLPMFSSCLARRRLIVRKGSNAAQPLLVADQAALLEAISRQYQAVHDFSATVDMVPALGSAEKSKITEYKDVRAYILFRQPAHIRIIGLYPVVRNKAFDMTSDGAGSNSTSPPATRLSRVAMRSFNVRKTSWKTCARSISSTP